MSNIELKLDAEPKDKYEKAKKILIEADEAIRALTSEEQEKLAYEFAQYKGICGLYKIIK